MYTSFREWCERFLRIPGDPEAPPGDEATTRLFRAAPNYYLYLIVVWALRTLALVAVIVPMEIIPFIGGFTRHFERHVPEFFLWRPPAIIATAIVIQRLIALALLRLDFEKRWYLVTDRSLRVREGVLKIREMTITFANIQNISISQGPIQRLLGIADLRVDTAGGGAQTNEKEGKENLHGVRFRGVNNADEIRELINLRLRELKDSGLGDHEELVQPAAHPEYLTTGLLPPAREILAEATALRAAIARLG
ncbi:MAG: PH domain-containing protein [Verrucomicrobiota bacterium]|nr:PH domain-containing protein [Verrucomicrobiota bacterium]